MCAKRKGAQRGNSTPRRQQPKSIFARIAQDILDEAKRKNKKLPYNISDSSYSKKQKTIHKSFKRRGNRKK